MFSPNQQEVQMDSKLVEIGSCFDWISPILAVAGDVIHGGSHTFLVPCDCGWSGREIARLLKQHGIQNWGHMVINKTLTISVRPAQARWAQYVLDRASIPLDGGRIECTQTRAGRPNRHARSGSQETRNVLSDIWNLPIFK
jgi:hypothetical protein